MTVSGEHFPRRTLRVDGREFKVDIITDSPTRYGGGWYLFGWQFGPVVAICADGIGAALDVWDEHYGQRVDVVADADTIRDYAPAKGYEGDDDTAARLCTALDDGDVRINDGGTTVWVDHSEWCREIAPSEARIRSGRLPRRR